MNKELITMPLTDVAIEGFVNVTAKHKEVSEVTTPKGEVKSEMGFDYVEYSYMRRISDEKFPGWSWMIIKTELIGDQAMMVHGRLTWYEPNGMIRVGDVVASHRIQKKRGEDSYVDIGNDIKSANTDAIKKAFNMYLNIADDVYRNTDESLTEEEKAIVLKNTPAGMKNDMITKIDDLQINRSNMEATIRKLRKMREEADTGKEKNE